MDISLPAPNPAPLPSSQVIAELTALPNSPPVTGNMILAQQNQKLIK